MIAVFAGGTSAEREVSLSSGAACASALARSFTTRLFRIDADALPEGLDPAGHVVFSTLHGTFGEDGGMQRLMDAAGVAYAGCDAASSTLTMDKEKTKAAMKGVGVPVVDAVVFDGSGKPAADAVISRLGPSLVLKPNNEGSSVGLRLTEDLQSLSEALGGVQSGRWLIERRIRGTEVSVGILRGKALGIVEVRPKAGVYDYASKYTAGKTEYLAPAPLGDALYGRVRDLAEAAFAACACRDYARVDFMISAAGEPFLLEINTLPGMKEMSLLPMCARCAGLDFTALVREMVSSAVERFHQSAGSRSP
jgi:D-alanine-D-alanine ligase